MEKCTLRIGECNIYLSGSNPRVAVFLVTQSLTQFSEWRHSHYFKLQALDKILVFPVLYLLYLYIFKNILFLSPEMTLVNLVYYILILYFPLLFWNFTFCIKIIWVLKETSSLSDESDLCSIRPLTFKHPRHLWEDPETCMHVSLKGPQMTRFSSSSIVSSWIYQIVSHGLL